MRRRGSQSVATGDCRDFGYVADDRWAKLPPNWKWDEVAGVAVDRQDRVYVFGRGEHPIGIFSADGTFLASWDENPFTRPHGISIGSDSATPDEVVFCTDDLGHAVRKFTTDGKLLLTLGPTGPAFRHRRDEFGLPYHSPSWAALPLSNQHCFIS